MRSSAVVSGVLFLVLLVLVAVGWSPLLSLDRSVAEALHRDAVARPGVTGFNRFLSDWVWDPWTMRALAAVTVGLLWWRRERRAALWVAGTSLVSVGLQQGLKSLVGRERPQWPDPVDSAQFAAFPSGHAMTAMVTCGLILWVLALHWREEWRGWGVLACAAVVSVLGVGWTRVYLGVHWASDVLGGWLLGWCCVAVAVLTYRWSERNGGTGGEGRGRPDETSPAPGAAGRRMGDTR
ncbi:phosphatase PAP2 family protein [Streptomyces sp. NBC_00094]|uniref:phosphatase PAP2 family protein n=1 Tax=Streptomyces sp. NBC_00094 TaxID=2903620 RepID=UPI00224FF2D2|nr:phosphatase PAP2 family protein [Streptomyces sp. NBC_00094]MCX5389178.1 phosphatase PAP2 family protein [Streptomyces sp. NBC_00094]